MRSKPFFAGVLAMVILTGIAACTPKNNSSQTPTAPVDISTTSPEATQSGLTTGGTSPAATATVDGEALIREKLQNHHDIERIFSAQKTREEWVVTLDRMISYGAKISEEEKTLIIDYLMNR
jgi:hypothetical protein